MDSLSTTIDLSDAQVEELSTTIDLSDAQEEGAILNFRGMYEYR